MPTPETTQRRRTPPPVLPRSEFSLQHRQEQEGPPLPPRDTPPPLPPRPQKAASGTGRAARPPVWTRAALKNRAPAPRTAPQLAPLPANAFPQPAAPTQMAAGRALSDEQRARFSQTKKGFLQRIVKRMDEGNYTLSDAQRKSPVEEENKGQDRVDATEKWGLGTASFGTGVSDTVGGFTHFNKSTTWKDVGNAAVKKSTWDDGSLQSDGFPIASAITKSIQCIFDMVKFIKKISEFSKENGKTEDGVRETTRDERWDMVKESLDAITGLADEVNSVLGTFTTWLGRLPIIGAIFGAVGAAVGFIADVSGLVKAHRSKNRMREQRSAAKSAVLAKQAPGSVPVTSAVTENREEVSRFRKIHTTKQKVRKEYSVVVDAGSHKTRAERLDERVAKMKESGVPEDQKGLVRDLEDYDVARELVRTNKNREREGWVSVIADDVVGFGASLAALDPSGIGAAVGSGLTAIVGGGKLGRDVGVAIRQAARNSGRFGANVNKSDQNKAQRRHNLAVIMFDRIAELKSFGFKDIGELTTSTILSKEQIKNITEGLPAYETVDERVSAMGVLGSLTRARSGKEMVDVMRKGFYRDND